MEQWSRAPNPGIAPHRPSVISDGFSSFISECGGGEMEGVSRKHLKAGDIVVRSAVGYATVDTGDENYLRESSIFWKIKNRGKSKIGIQ